MSLPPIVVRLKEGQHEWAEARNNSGTSGDVA
jgi:hypothetical protein